ncbi:Sec-independent protein translocase protein TatB [Pseudomonas sp. N3-W]|uniref:Sec-independent protein translocase protein TatB n=1 Tax=Pseudomonas fungipugnans TaxID=3024217 RepID=A0ABT6QQY5_9PSED|nr:MULTISPECIES: Sec-independent protein translocase protein TatB [unclassified Pseudomonas]MDI2593306.1 Sec-independent protein translocase protein TatB [Pseudomonas sp. 681]UWF49751.1 Sec-independent protein translocase protein TatB [Pseudomonas sp. N3-W]
MFGISFSELLLVGLVALLVLGPERLPGAARTAGLWVGRLKRSFNAIKQEVEREIGADEIRRQLHNEHILSLEQEARKIFTPTQQEATPVQPAESVEHVAQQTIHAPGTEPVATVAGVEPAPVVVTPPPAEPVAPAAAPTAPAPHDPTLAPRAP